MEVILSEVKEGGLELNGHYDPEVLCLNTSQITFKTPISASLKAQRVKGTLYVHVSVRVDMNCICSRCLDEFPASFSENFHFDYKVGREKSIDVTDDVRQEIIIAYPIKALCKGECKGLCQTCGKNLNEGDCQCPKVSFSPFENLI